MKALDAIRSPVTTRDTDPCPPEAELGQLHAHYTRLAAMAKREREIGESHSIEEAESRHERKQEDEAPPRKTKASG